jgi:hypothetical protein
MLQSLSKTSSCVVVVVVFVVALVVFVVALVVFLDEKRGKEMQS